MLADCVRALVKPRWRPRAAHTVGRAGTNVEACRADGVDAAGRGHMRRVVVEHHGAGVQRQRVTGNRTTDATADGCAAGSCCSVVGLAQRAANAGA